MRTAKTYEVNVSEATSSTAYDAINEAAIALGKLHRATGKKFNAAGIYGIAKNFYSMAFRGLIVN
jgi:hypothetical protein